MASNTKLRLAIEHNDFGAIIHNKLTFVDKSLLIKDIIEDPHSAILITRPQRFGKTFNMSMLHYFFAEKVSGQPTKGLFDSLKIAQESHCMEQQGKYPVVFLTLKDVKSQNYLDCYEIFKSIICKLYQEHQVVLEKSEFYEKEEQDYKAILAGTASETQVQKSLQSLIYYLYRYYGKKPVLLIDAYDTPLQAGYAYSYQDKIINFMQGFLSLTLKNNTYVYKAVLTGVLWIAKESLFTGLNNLKVYSLLSTRYAEYFGFTEEEVKQLFVQAGSEEKFKEAKLWYNGYQIGNRILYNSGSIAHCVAEEGILKSYEINTPNSLLVQRLLIQSSVNFKKKLQILMQGESVELILDEDFVYPKALYQGSARWSLLLMSGYLTVLSAEWTLEGSVRCKLIIPNLEAKELYKYCIKEWLSNERGIPWYNKFIEYLLLPEYRVRIITDVSKFIVESFITGNQLQRGFEKILEENIGYLLLQIARIHDLSREPEAFYQGFLLGLISILDQKDYSLQCHQDTYQGLYNIAIIPQDIKRMSVLIALKSVVKPKHLEKALKVALADVYKQIKQPSYSNSANLERQLGMVCKIGLAFSGTNLKIIYGQENQIILVNSNNI